MKCKRGTCPNVGFYQFAGLCNKHFRSMSRERAKRGGYENKWVPAAEVIAHIEKLHARMSWTAMSRVTHTSSWTLRCIVKQKFVHARTAQRILAASIPPLIEVAPDHAVIDATGTRRRIQALVRMGYSYAAIGEEAGVCEASINRCTSRVTAGVARRIAIAFKGMQMRQPPDTPYTRRNQNYAAKKGWPPPFAWNEDEIDDPEAKPHCVRRPAKKVNSEWYESYRELREMGLSVAQIAEREGITRDTLYHRLARRGLPA